MKTKLAPHFMDGGLDVAAPWIETFDGGWLKCAEMDLDWLKDPAKLALLRRAKERGYTIMGRCVEDAPDIEAADILAEAQKYAAHFLPMIRAFPDVDYWEGPNEIGGMDARRMERYAAFLYEFARLIYAWGKRAAIGAWSVGTPDIGLWAYWRKALKATNDFKAIMTRHSYGQWDNVWLGLRHRLDAQAWALLGFRNVPLVISEFGADGLPANAGQAPWRRQFGGDVGRYWREYLKPWLEETANDEGLLAAALFTIGTGGGDWNEFDGAHTDQVPIMVADPPVVTPPKPTGTHSVTASVLNVRQFPWLESYQPRVMGQLFYRDVVTVTDTATYGPSTWAHIGPDRWVAGRYLAKL